MADSVTPLATACQVMLSSTISWSLLKYMSIETVMLSNHFILHCPIFFFPWVWLSIRFFCGESALLIRWRKYWSFSFSISLYMKFRVEISYGWLVWSCCPRDSQATSPAPELESINSPMLSLLYGPTLISIHDCWKNHSFDYRDLCQQSNISAF